LEKRTSLPNATRAAIQLLVMTAHAQAGQEIVSQLQQLQSHLPEIRERVKNFEALALGIWKYSGVGDKVGLDFAQLVFGLVFGHYTCWATGRLLILTVRS
jgi:hypothetical protein